MIDIGKKLWKTYKKQKIKVFLVDGNAVRNKLGVSYGIGGHERGYNFIPKQEIWLEKSLDPKERDIILLHELYERKRMIRDKWNFLNAHHGATIAEWYARHNPTKTKAKIREVLAM
jgi:hypothetical protein